MTAEATQQKAIRQYFLGQLSPEELREMEERLLTDTAFYDELLIEEDELVDQYLRGDLSVAELEFFKSHFLCTPERQQKLGFATALRTYLASGVVSPAQDDAAGVEIPAREREVPEPPPKWRLFSFLHIQSPVLGFAMAAVALVIFFGAFWVIQKNWLQPQPHDILTAVLVPGQTRTGDPNEVKTLIIAPGKDTVRLQLELLDATDYPSYRAELQDAAGTVLQQQVLTSQPLEKRSVVILDIPAGKLPANDYQVKLTGVIAGGKEEKLGSYRFKVSR